MPIPLGVYIAVASGIGTGGIAAYFAKKADGSIEEIAKDTFDELLGQGVELVEDIFGNVGNEILEVLEGAGESIIKGLDNAFEYLKDRFIRGKEPDIVAGFTVTILSIATLVYLYNSVKNSNDAF